MDIEISTLDRYLEFYHIFFMRVLSFSETILNYIRF